MAWGYHFNSQIARGFASMHAELRSCRSPTKLGKKLANETHVYLVEGTMADPQKLVVKMGYQRKHKEPLMTFYKDGSMEFHLPKWISPTIYDRVESYSDSYIATVDMEPINGFLPAQSSVLVLCNTKTNEKVPVGRGEALTVRIKPDGSFDYDTVTAIDIEVITDPGAVRAATRHMSAIARQIEVRKKLEAGPPLNRGGGWNRETFLIENIDRPLDEIDYDQLAEPYFNPRHGRFNASGLTYQVARKLGVTTKLSTKTIHLPVAI